MNPQLSIADLAYAAQTNDLPRVRTILDHRPDLINIDLAQNDEHRAIHFAVMNRAPDMVRLLMDRGADAHAGIYPHRCATTAHQIATDREYTEIVAIIEDAESRRAPAPDADESDAQSDPEHDPLTAAVLRDDIAEITNLLDNGADPNQRTRVVNLEEDVWSAGKPLWTCASNARYEIAELLLQRGADPNVHVYAGGSSVFSAYTVRDFKMIELLKRYGGIVDPITVGLFGETGIARQMIADEAAGCLNAGKLEGRNVSEDLLRGAADGGHPEIVRMALPNVDWPRGDDRWFWILMHAIWGPHPECFRLVLERSGATLRHPRFGRTILHDVAALGGPETAAQSPVFAEMLLDAGASLTDRDDILKSTPLGWACRWGRTSLVQFLLEHGADPHEPDAKPWATPSAWAKKKRLRLAQKKYAHARAHGVSDIVRRKPDYLKNCCT